MRKTLVLALAFWAGFSNFAYASARLECVAMMQRSACHAMPQVPSDPSCPCKIQAPTDHRVVADTFVLQADPSFDLLRPAQPRFFEGRPVPVFGRSHGPPPGLPLYNLFSVYRI